MMFFCKKINYYSIFILSSFIVLSACGSDIDNSPPISSQEATAILEVSPDLLSNSENVKLTTKDWSYNEAKHNIIINALKQSEDSLNKTTRAKHEPIQIVFNNVLLAEDPKSSNPIIKHALARFALDEDYAVRNKLLVNGEPHSGLIEGIIEIDGKKITVFEINLSKGDVIGKITVVSNSGKLFEGNGKYMIDIDVDNTARKPVIYLYPSTKTNINVRVNFKGELTHTYPKYSVSQGWTVTAKPDGELRDEKTGKTYYNLFWEGESTYKYDLSTGFVVKGEEVADFLDEKLEKLGLNRREANEFITYWLPEMEKNKYNLVHFSTTEYQAQAQLEVSPKADTEIRVFMVYQPLDVPINIMPQILQTPVRKGFTLVEWGGKIQIKDNL